MTKTNMLMVAMYDWENKRLHTQFGLCWYFKSVFDIDDYNIKMNLTFLFWVTLP